MVLLKQSEADWKKKAVDFSREMKIMADFIVAYSLYVQFSGVCPVFSQNLATGQTQRIWIFC